LKYRELPPFNKDIYLHSANVFCIESIAADTVDSHLNRWRDECSFGSFSVGVQTPTEIAELRLRSSHPVKTPE